MTIFERDRDRAPDVDNVELDVISAIAHERLDFFEQDLLDMNAPLHKGQLIAALDNRWFFLETPRSVLDK